MEPERELSSEARLDQAIFTSIDAAVVRLHELSETNRELFGFLHDFQHSREPHIEMLYGPRGTDRLEKLQYDVDSPRKLVVPGAYRDIVRVQISTWGSEIRKDPAKIGKLNEDAAIVAPFGYGRLVAAVFDGASSQRPIRGLARYGISGSWYVSHLASLGFPHSEEYKQLENDHNTTAYDFIAALNKWLRIKLEDVEGVDYNDFLSIPGMAATIAIADYGDRKISIAHAADTLGVAEFDDHYEILTDDKNDRWDEETRRLIDSIVQENLKQGRVIRPVEAKRSQRVRDHIAASFLAKINTRTGTGIVNGQEELLTNGLVYTSSVEIPENSGLKLHIVSDGIHSMWTSRDDLKDNKDLQIRKLLAALNTKTYNPGNPITRVTDRIEQDPGGYLFRRAMDDATRVSLGIIPGYDDSPFNEENERLLAQDHHEISRFLQNGETEIMEALTEYSIQNYSHSS